MANGKAGYEGKPGGTGKAATPWGPATLVEELTLPQRAGEKRFSSLVQLLETERGEKLVRFSYSTGGTARRGPVTLRSRDVRRLLEGLAEHPGLADALALPAQRQAAAAEAASSRPRAAATKEARM
jgi:hypothetical protein